VHHALTTSVLLDRLCATLVDRYVWSEELVRTYRPARGDVQRADPTANSDATRYFSTEMQTRHRGRIHTHTHTSQWLARERTPKFGSGCRAIFEPASSRPHPAGAHVARGPGRPCPVTCVGSDEQVCSWGRGAAGHATCAWSPGRHADRDRQGTGRR
jgi:hypothetical protein